MHDDALSFLVQGKELTQSSEAVIDEIERTGIRYSLQCDTLLTLSLPIQLCCLRFPFATVEQVRWNAISLGTIDDDNRTHSYHDFGSDVSKSILSILLAVNGNQCPLSHDVWQERHLHVIDYDIDKRHPPRHGLLPIFLRTRGSETIYLRFRFVLIA